MNLPEPDAPRAKSQPQRVFDGVADRIRSGALKPGDRGPSEPELMKQFGVSRTVVREAMSRLQAGGQVETRQGVGTFVLASPAGEPLLDITRGEVKARQVLAMLELRISIESEAASLAAARRTEAHLAAMRAALDDFDAHRRAGERTSEDDFRFHAQIAAATGNEYFEEVLASLGSATLRRVTAEAEARAPGGGPRFGDPLPSLEPGKEVTQAEHEAIYEAIVRGDGAAARAAMFIHLSNSRQRLRRKTGVA